MLNRIIIISLAFCSLAPTCAEAQLGRIPSTAAIVFHDQNRIYVMDADGSHRTRITSDTTRTYEHVAVCPGRRFIVSNFNKTNGQSHPSKLMLYDLQTGRTIPLLQNFHMAGNGGVDCDASGRLYFAAIQALPFPNPTTPEQNIANAGANEVWRVKWDGTGLQRLTNTPDRGEADVAIHPTGNAMTYNALHIQPPNDIMELWIAALDGTNARPAYVAPDTIHTVHDPEVSPDAAWLVFSQYNPDFKNFPNDPNANTAQDVYKLQLATSEMTLISELGLISIAPDWGKNNEILFLQASDRTTPPWSGLVIRDPSGKELRRFNDVNIAKWIP